LGYVPNTHISSILGHADLFVLPSLYEGFGLPVLEAQQAGVAVACSTAGSLPEIAGEGAVFFDPLSSDDMARVIRECLSDLALCTRLRRMGAENVQRFSWDKTARETLAVYRQVALCLS
jgi:glycosyltransferase involved in cell wall biosynthesis